MPTGLIISAVAFGKCRKGKASGKGMAIAGLILNIIIIIHHLLMIPLIWYFFFRGPSFNDEIVYPHYESEEYYEHKG